MIAPRPHTVTRRGPAPAPRASGRAAFSLVEVVVSILIISIMAVAALNALGAAKTAQFKQAQQSRALMLAQDLLAEILQLPYKDPEAPGGIGREPGEYGLTRGAFDDIDDYHNWTASPPQRRDGSEISWAADYTRSVRVQYVTPDSLVEVPGPATGVKQISVTVRQQQRLLVTLEAYRTAAWQDPADIQGAGP